MLINIRESKLGSFDMSFYHENMGVSVFFQNLSVSDRKGLISRVAQWISPGIILILINHAPGYQNQQRKNFIRQNQVQPHDSLTNMNNSINVLGIEML